MLRGISDVCHPTTNGHRRGVQKKALASPPAPFIPLTLALSLYPARKRAFSPQDKVLPTLMLPPSFLYVSLSSYTRYDFVKMAPELNIVCENFVKALTGLQKARTINLRITRRECHNTITSPRRSFCCHQNRPRAEAGQNHKIKIKKTN